MGILSTSTLRSLTDSLGADPFYRAVVSDFASDPERARQVLSTYFDIAARQSASAGKVVLSDPPGIGAALWLLPCDEKIAASARVARVSAMERELGPVGFATYKQIAAFMSEASAPYISGTWWYLSILGISPALYGQGHGVRLLAPTLAEADEAGAFCWLTTFVPRNHTFYRRLGFVKAASIFEPNIGHDYSVMIRRPCTPADATR